VQRLTQCILIMITALLCFFSHGFAESPPPAWLPSGTDAIMPVGDKNIVVGTPVSSTATEYLVWSKKDADGDVLATMVITCTDLTDGTEDCTVKIYEITDGTLVEQGTWP